MLNGLKLQNMNKMIIWGVLILLVSIIPSCTDLDEKAFDVLPAKNYFQDRKTVEAALLRPYEHGHWCGWDGDRWYLQELSADHFVWAQKGKHGYDGGNHIRIHGHVWNIEEGQIYGGWIGPYQGIGQCNTIIRDFEALDFPALGLTDAEKAEYISELRTLRAWFYMFVLDLFRSVPIVVETDEVKEQSPPEVTFAFIEKEILESLPSLKQEAQRGRWTQAGAAALLVRLYLNAETWIGISRYDDCAKIAQEIIDKKYGNFELDPDFRGPFRSGINGYRSVENIFEFPHAKNYYEFGWMYDATMHYQTRYSLDTDKGGWNGVTLTPSRDLKGELYPYKLGSPYERFAATDLRKKPFKTFSKTGDYEGFFQVNQTYGFNSSDGYGFDSTKMILGTEEWANLPLSFVDQIGRFSEDPALKKSESESESAYNARMLAYFKEVNERGYHIATSSVVLDKGSDATAGEESSGIRLLKFPWLPLSANLFMFNSAPEIRIAEMYYSLAECKYRAGDKAGAAILLDAVRIRNFSAVDWAAQSYVNGAVELTDDEFIADLGREFLGERHRRTDLVRWKRFGDEWWAKPKDTEDKSVFPIPSRALNANPKLVPNGY